MAHNAVTSQYAAIVLKIILTFIFISKIFVFLSSYLVNNLLIQKLHYIIS